MGAGKVEVGRVRSMLGLADKGRIFDLLRQLLGGAAGEALDALRATASRRRRAAARCWPTSPMRCTSPRGPRRSAPLLPATCSRPKRSAARPRSRKAVGRDPGARLADPAQGPRGDGRGAQSDGGGRDGADPPRLHGRPAGTRRDHQGARWRHRLSRLAGKTTAPGEQRPLAAAAPRARSHPEDEDREKRSGIRSTKLGRAIAPPRCPSALVCRCRGVAGEQREAKLKVQLEEHVSLVKFDLRAASSCTYCPARPRSSATSCARS